MQGYTKHQEVPPSNSEHKLNNPTECRITMGNKIWVQQQEKNAIFYLTSKQTQAQVSKLDALQNFGSQDL